MCPPNVLKPIFLGAFSLCSEQVSLYKYCIEQGINNAPINIMPHYPSQAMYVKEKVGHLTPTVATYVGNLTAHHMQVRKCRNTKDQIFCLIFWVGRRLRFDYLTCPMVMHLNLCDLNPLHFPYIVM